MRSWTGPLAAPRAVPRRRRRHGFSMAAGAVPEGARSGRPGWRNAKRHAGRQRARRHGAPGPGRRQHRAARRVRGAGDPVRPLRRRRELEDRAAARPRAAAGASRSRSDDVRFANADAEGALQLQWHSGPNAAPRRPPRRVRRAPFGRGRRFPGDDRPQGRADARARRAPRALPAQAGPGEHAQLPRRARSPAGEMDNVRFNVRGDLAGFPYQRQHDGDFRIDGHVRGVDLDLRARRAGRRRHARAVAVARVHAGGRRGRARSRRARDPRRQRPHGRAAAARRQRRHRRTCTTSRRSALHGQVTGPMTDFLRYVAQSPVGGWLHNGLASDHGHRQRRARPGLNIPLQHGEQTSVNGALTLAGNDVQPGRRRARARGRARARVAFTEKGVTVSGGHARALGGDADVRRRHAARRRAALHRAGRGRAPRACARSPTSRCCARLASHVSGQAAYKLSHRDRQGPDRVRADEPAGRPRPGAAGAAEQAGRRDAGR